MCVYQTLITVNKTTSRYAEYTLYRSPASAGVDIHYSRKEARQKHKMHYHVQATNMCHINYEPNFEANQINGNLIEATLHTKAKYLKCAAERSTVIVRTLTHHHLLFRCCVTSY